MGQDFARTGSTKLIQRLHRDLKHQLYGELQLATGGAGACNDSGAALVGAVGLEQAVAGLGPVDAVQ